MEQVYVSITTASVECHKMASSGYPLFYVTVYQLSAVFIFPLEHHYYIHNTTILFISS